MLEPLRALRSGRLLFLLVPVATVGAQLVSSVNSSGTTVVVICYAEGS